MCVLCLNKTNASVTDMMILYDTEMLSKFINVVQVCSPRLIIYEDWIQHT